MGQAAELGTGIACQISQLKKGTTEEGTEWSRGGGRGFVSRLVSGACCRAGVWIVDGRDGTGVERVGAQA